MRVRRVGVSLLLVREHEVRGPAGTKPIRSIEVTREQRQRALHELGVPLGMTREHLRETIWGQVPEMNSRTLDTHISRVRTQLDLRPANGYLITSVYGVGYRFESVESADLV